MKKEQKGKLESRNLLRVHRFPVTVLDRMMEDLDFSEVIDLIRKEDNRYEKSAYFFLRSALDYTVKKVRKQHAVDPSRSSHVTGQELLEGIRDYAIDQFGPLAYTVLQEWNVRRCSDFGEMVYNLIEFGVFSKTDEDRKEDFADIYSFEDAFMKPFQPARRRLPPLSNLTIESS